MSTDCVKAALRTSIVLCDCNAGEKHLGEAKLREITHAHRIQDAREVVALMLYHPRMKALGPEDRKRLFPHLFG